MEKIEAHKATMRDPAASASKKNYARGELVHLARQLVRLKEQE